MLERIYNIPLRKEFLKVPIYKRASKSIRTVRKFLQRHMKCENVLIGRHLNMKIHEHGRKNVCHHVHVKAIKDKEKIDNKEIEIVRAELAGFEIEKPKSEKEKKKAKKEEKAETKADELMEKIKEAQEEKLEKAEKEEHKIIHDKLEKREVETNIDGKFPDKEESIKMGRETIISKREKPKHERKTEKIGHKK